MKKEDSLQLKFKFLRLRAIDGKSFDQIVTELGVSKPTLIKWEKESVDILDDIRNAEIQNMISIHSIDLKTRLFDLIELSKKISFEISQRDLANLPTKTLIEMVLLINAKIEKIEIDSRISSMSLLGESNQYFTESLPDKNTENS